MLRKAMLLVLVAIDVFIIGVLLYAIWLVLSTDAWLLDEAWLVVLGVLATAISSVIAWLLKGSGQSQKAPATAPPSTQTTTSIEGDATVGGDIVGRDKIINNFIEKGEAPPAEDPGAGLEIYREVLSRRCRNIPLSGLDPAADDAGSEYRGMSLEQVFIELDTTTRVRQDKPPAQDDEATEDAGQQSPERLLAEDHEETRPLSAVEAVAGVRAAVLLGDPGSGKSTVVNRLCLALATGQWADLDAYPQAERERLPILIVLRDFARWLADRETGGGDAALLLEYLIHDLKRQKLDFMVEQVISALDRDAGAMVFLDGLDEVPPAHRQVVLGAGTGFCRSLRQGAAAGHLPGGDL